MEVIMSVTDYSNEEICIGGKCVHKKTAKQIRSMKHVYEFCNGTIHIWRKTCS
jgi:hypothetical protein